jgi:adenylylsulfate kinase
LIIWLTGLSASGKTSIGTELVRLWKAETPNVVFMDGDEVRRVLEWKDGTDDYTRDVRHRIAWRYSDMCAWLDSQDINVVCSGICFFDDVRKRNRETFSSYFEAYIDVPMEILRKRDNKNLYARAFKGEIKNVVGVDLMLEPPTAPDMVIDNSEDGADLAAIAADVLTKATG